MKRILTIDDNYKIHKSLKLFFTQNDFHYLAANNSQEAFQLIRDETPDIILLDLSLGEENGLDVLRELNTRTPQIPVIMITGYATLESAIQAIKIGAVDFLEKPLDFDKLLFTLSSALNTSNNAVKTEPKITAADSRPDYTVTHNHRMQEIWDTARSLARSNIPILIYGESGTGKELMADYIHQCSQRSNNPLVKVNCSAIAESLLDNELFGHEEGSYTGATGKHIGMFEQACGGSLHLDEIGDMSMTTQAKILRAIQYGEIRRVGGQSTISVNVRFIASTNKNLQELITRNLFREDLLYRLNAASIILPPLRERKEDIPRLADIFLRQFATGSTPKALSTEALSTLQQHDWPGNIRELRNTIEVSVTLCQNQILRAEDIKFHSSLEPNGSNSHTAPVYDLEQSEKQVLIDALKTTNMNRTKAAKLLGISRKTLYNKLIKYDIKVL